ncbi:MAG TPA: TonB-dependent receptor, partial [Flavobacteriaceae bacterium]|nr:TonB-dependent receptor [Flavobacteriaceae bacterium]
IPSVRVQKSQFGGGSPVLRGMEANRVLLVVDGVRMNNAIYRTGHLQNSITVSPTVLERTEVVFGPSSVIYGSDALGGVIHFYTKTPKISENKEIEASLFSRYSTINNEITTSADVEISSAKWASFSSISHSSFSDLKMGSWRAHNYNNWGKVFAYSNNTEDFYNPDEIKNSNPEIQRNTGFKQTDLLQKFLVPFSEKTDFLLNFQYSESSNIDRFDKLTEYDEGNLKWAEWHYGPQKRMLLSAQLKINPNKTWLEKGSITAAYQNIKESRIQRKFNSLDRSYRKENLDVLSLNGDFFVPLGKSSNRVLAYGFEFTHNDVNSNAFGKTLDVENNDIVGYSGDFKVQSRYPDGGSNYSSLASYLNYRQNISKKATLNTGLRFVQTYLKAKWVDDTFITLPDWEVSLKNSAVTATLGYVYKPTTDWHLSSVISSGFRSPNIDDVGKIREKSGKVTVPNTQLKPEYAYNFEAGALKYFKNKKFQVGLNFYYTLLHNYITRDYFMLNNSPTIMYDGEQGNVVANVNKDNAYILGSTLTFKGNLTPLWYTKGSLTYTEGKAYDTELPLSSIPPLFGKLEIGFQKEKFQTNINWRFNAKKPLEDYNLIEGIDNIEQTPYNLATNKYEGTPAWYTLNLHANYQLNNTIKLFFNVENILDLHYKEFASSISAPGRNFSMSIIVNF